MMVGMEGAHAAHDSSEPSRDGGMCPGILHCKHMLARADLLSRNVFGAGRGEGRAERHKVSGHR